jgi:hypothetical protein
MVTIVHQGSEPQRDDPEASVDPTDARKAKVTISRAMNSSTLPADFILVAAMNPCPCG